MAPNLSLSQKTVLHGSDDQGQLRLEVGDVGCVLQDDGQVSGPLVVETEVLGERLGHEELEVSLVDEVPDGPGVSLQVAGGESLVSAVEEGEQLLLLHDVSDQAPLKCLKQHF